MPITILMADDDADDRTLTKEALEEGRLMNELRFVENGEELLEYLRKQGKYAPPTDAQSSDETTRWWLAAVLGGTLLAAVGLAAGARRTRRRAP